MVDTNTRQGKRTPVTLKIKFKSETLDQFIERYAVDVSQGGIFIRTKEPLAVGTQMKFEFQLRDASPLIAGEGTVVWTRENDPSRPAIAPGMGVRFDRLADGSQGILERILTEKAKQAPQRPAAETTKPPLFTDTPTRVAPAPVQEALLGKDGRSRRDDVGHSDSHTPLPRPMPFHSDADEFPDEAFEEATKVRALDELIAQTAEGDNKDEITSRGRPNGRTDATIPDPALLERPELRPIPLPSHAELQDVPDLPNPPDLMRPQPRMLDVSPSPRMEGRVDSMPPSLPEALAKTRLGVEPAPRMRGPTPPPPTVPISPPSVPPLPPPPQVGMFGPPPGSALGEVPPLPSGMRAVAAEQTEPARMPPLRSRSIAPLLILIFLLVAAAGAAVWFFVLRAQMMEPQGGSVAGPAEGSAAGSAGAGAAVAAAGTTGSAAPAEGSAAPAPGGSAAPAGGSAVAAAAGSATKADLIDTTIAASTDGATVEITGTDQSGPAPFTAKLEKGKPYKARITARGFAALELDIKGGDAKQTAKLVAKPRLINITTDPAGATISVDGTPTGHATPFEVELTAAQAAKKTIHVVLRKSGFRSIDKPMDIAKYTEDDTRMTAKIDEKLTTAPTVATPRPPAGSGTPHPAAGSDTATPASGSDGAAPAQGSSDGPVTSPNGTPTPPPSAAPSPPPAAAPSPSPSAGNGSGSTEPEPDFNKQH